MSHFDKNGYVLIGLGRRGLREREHVLVAQAALGKRLPKGAIVHHVDEDRTNNRPSNLVICQDRAYHNLLHQRMRAVAACGDANWRHCCRCLKYDAPENLSISGEQAFHPACNTAHVKRMKEKNAHAR